MANKFRITVNYPSFELGDLFVRQGIRLGDNGNEVDFGVELPHELDVNRLQSASLVSVFGTYLSGAELTSGPLAG